MLEQTALKPVLRGTNGLHDITTETSNAASEGFDTKSALEIARIINHDDAKVSAAVRSPLSSTSLPAACATAVA
jgi:N-acetylmuramic acid 6-phosphate etherase